MHVEIPCREREEAKRFYGNIFGWKFEDTPEMEYTMFDTGAAPGGGFFIPTEFNPGGVLNYILVESIEGISEKIESAGGKVIVPKTEIPQRGWFAAFEDPSGAVMALYESMRREG